MSKKSIIPFLSFFLLGTIFTAGAEDLKPEAVEQTAPLALKPLTLTKNGVEINVTPLQFPEPLLSGSTFKGVQGIAVHGGKLYVSLSNDDTIRAFNIPKEKSDTKLTPDASFADKGILTGASPGGLKQLFVNPKGELFAVGSVRRKTQVYDGTGKKLKLYDGVVVPHASGAMFGLMREGVTPPQEDGTLSEQLFKFSNLDASKTANWVGDNIGIAVSNDKAKAVKVIDRQGKTKFEIGNPKDAFAPDGFCLIHCIASVQELLVVVDSNCRKISLWTLNGKFVACIKTIELGLGSAWIPPPPITFPWIPGITFDSDGTGYLIAGQQRKAKDGKGAKDKIFESVILRIEGLGSLRQSD